MGDADAVTLGKIHYYLREKYYRHAQNAALEGLKKYGNDSVLKYYVACTTVLEGRTQEGIRDLDLLRDKKDVNLCTTLALLHAHRMGKATDKEAINELDAKLKEERKQAGDKALYFAGIFLMMIDRPDKAKDYIDRVLKVNERSKEGLVAKGWLEMMADKEGGSKRALKYFEDALGLDTSEALDPDALFGKARFHESRRNFSGALELVNQVVVASPGYLPAFIEKMKLQLALQDWDQVFDCAQRALAVDTNCIDAHRYLILSKMCKEGAYSEASSDVGELIRTLDRVEPKSGHIYVALAQLFSRVCGRNRLVLQQTYDLAERAVSISNTSADFLNELGYQLLLQGKTKESMRSHRSAMKLDETSVAALTGVIRCQLADGQLDEAAQQLDFLKEIEQTIGRSPELSYLSALLAKKRSRPQEEVVALLGTAVEAHFAAVKGLPLGITYYVTLNPDFVLQVVKDYLDFAPNQPASAGQPAHPVLRQCSMVLEPLCRAVPGLMEAMYLTAKVKYLMGDMDGAQATLQCCLDGDSTFSDAHILMAQIHLGQGNFTSAAQSLEVGLSYNFEVREHPQYHLIKARIQRKQGDLQDARKTLQTTMQLPGVKTGRVTSGKANSRQVHISVNDRVSVFLELAEVHRLLGEQPEASKVMQDAIDAFRGTPEEVRISIANSDLALARGDVEGALTALRAVGPEQPYFIQAREKMADIYLHHRKDRRLYASCYRELAEKCPSSQTNLLLGDAYMAIQEPDKAIEVFETALKKNPRDGALARKIGQALVKTHNYGRAISYYEAAVRQGSQNSLKYDLSELLLRLRQYDKAEKVLRSALETDEPVNDLEVMIMHTKYLLLLAKVHQSTGKAEDAMLALTKAKDMQSRVVKRSQVEQPDSVFAHKQLAATICSEMGKQLAEQRDFDKATKLYKEAIMHTDADGKLTLELANLYLTMDDLDGCQHQLASLLKSDKESDAATVMMADLMFRKSDYDQAAYHFQQLLSRKPDHWQVLSRLIDLMRRAGKLDECSATMKKAEEANTNADMQPGNNYCQGLYAWYTGNPNDALKHFNKARKDSEWGQKALCCMIEICLNPDNDTIGGEVLETVDADGGSERAEGEMLAIRTAEKLIKDLRPRPGDLRPKILENMALVATKNKANVEKAIAVFTEITNENPDHVGASYGLAAAFMVLKQSPRARNQLKRQMKSTWTIQDAEELEKSWLLLADINIQTGKYDVASELLKRVLQYNKSCCKAYEYIGYIMEKEQNHKEAARNYELAWRYGNKNNPVIGYKLGFNYLKARRNVDAIDIAHHVLSKHPNYPKIRKDVLEKARNSLRV